MRLQAWLRDGSPPPGQRATSRPPSHLPAPSSPRKGWRKEARPQGFLLSVRPSWSKDTGEGIISWSGGVFLLVKGTDTLMLASRPVGVYLGGKGKQTIIFDCMQYLGCFMELLCIVKNLAWTNAVSHRRVCLSLSLIFDILDWSEAEANTNNCQR